MSSFKDLAGLGLDENQRLRFVWWTPRMNHKIIHQELQKSGMTTHVVQDEKDSLTLFTEPDNVKLSFFGDLGMGRVGTPTQTDDGIVSVASPLDLLGTKLKVITQRAEAKDCIDIAQLLRDGSKP